MARKMNVEIKKPRNVVERNIALLDSLMRYLLTEPRILGSLPDQFELVILPDDDPEMRLYNLQLLDSYGSAGKPIVFARVKSGKRVAVRAMRPSIYVPLAV